MNINQLEKILLDNKVHPGYYNLDGKRIDNTLCLKHENNRWFVFFEERGKTVFSHIFFKEDEACDFFLNKIRGYSGVNIKD